MTRVVHLISSLATGGTEMMLFKLLRGMRGTGVESTVVCLTTGGAIEERIARLGIPVFNLNMRRGIPNPLALWRLYRILRRLKPDVLQTWLYHADLLGLAAARLAGVHALTWNVRCSTTDERYRRGMTGFAVRALARLSHVPNVVVVNSDAGLRVHEDLGYRPRRWRVIPNGFEIDRFVPDAAAYAGVREELGLASDTVLIGLIARYDPLKDHETFLRAAAHICRDDPRVHLLLVGCGVDPSNGALTGLANALGITGNVHLLGERPDIPSLTAALDVATCSSRGEGFPNVVGEAMACAVPVVATNVGDLAAVIGDTGIVTPIGDVQGFAAGLRTVLALTPEARLELGKRARARIADRYDLRKVVGDYVTLYRELATH